VKSVDDNGGSGVHKAVTAAKMAGRLISLVHYCATAPWCCRSSLLLPTRYHPFSSWYSRM
jgi:hypothetical protein